MTNNNPAAHTALITGASAGIGYELAKLMAQKGYNLVLVARSEDKLEAMALQFAINHKIYAKVIVADLSKPSAPASVFDAVKQSGLIIDVLVNNAGFGYYGPFRESDLQRELDMMQLNMVSLAHLSKLFLSQLPKGHPGKILNVSSTAAFPPAGPYMAVYYATKAFVQSFSEGLAAELEDENITVTALCPGPTDTDFKETADLEGSGLFSQALVADAKHVAEAGYEGMMAGEVVVIPGIHNKAVVFSMRFAPRALLRKMVKRVQKKRGH